MWCFIAIKILIKNSHAVSFRCQSQLNTLYTPNTFIYVYVTVYAMHITHSHTHILIHLHRTLHKMFGENRCECAVCAIHNNNNKQRIAIAHQPSNQPTPTILLCFIIFFVLYYIAREREMEWVYVCEWDSDSEREGGWCRGRDRHACTYQNNRAVYKRLGTVFLLFLCFTALIRLFCYM